MPGKQEKFDDPERAVQYLCAGLARDYPGAALEIVQVVKNRSRKARCTVEEAAGILSQACQRFPMASVEYQPDNPYGFVAEIRCHGEMSGRTTTFRRHTADRARVLVMVKQVGDEEVLVGKHRVPGS